MAQVTAVLQVGSLAGKLPHAIGEAQSKQANKQTKEKNSRSKTTQSLWRSLDSTIFAWLMETSFRNTSAWLCLWSDLYQLILGSIIFYRSNSELRSSGKPYIIFFFAGGGLKKKKSLLYYSGFSRENKREILNCKQLAPTTVESDEPVEVGLQLETQRGVTLWAQRPSAGRISFCCSGEVSLCSIKAFNLLNETHPHYGA